MQVVSKVTSVRRRTLRALIGGAVLSVGAIAAVLPSLGASASATTRSGSAVLRAINVSKYPGVLGNAKSHSLYLLHDELGGKLHCTGECLQFWLPVYVREGEPPLGRRRREGQGRDSGPQAEQERHQVPAHLQRLPRLHLLGRPGPKQANGEHVKFGGVYWYLLRAL